MKKTTTTTRPQPLVSLCTWAAVLLMLAGIAACGDSTGEGPVDSSVASDSGMTDGTVPPDGSPDPDAGDTGPAGDSGSPADSSVDDGGVVDDGLHPVLSGFRVEAGEPGRVYFDSSEPITASNAMGFVVTGKTLASVAVNSGGTTGHYFTISEAFSFWDNNTIRYEGGGDVEDLEGNALYSFTLRYIENGVPEPEAATNRYVSVGGGGSHDGTSEANAWTMAQAGDRAAPGQTVWLKAGDYGNRPLHIDNSGTAGNPIKFIGYTTTPGDSPRLTRDQDTVFDSAMMPHIRSSGTTGSGINFAGERYLIVKNIQVTGYDHCLLANGNVSEILIENVYVRGGRYGFNLFAYRTTNTRVKGSYVSNASGAGIRVAGHYNQIDDMYASSRGVPSMDYYISIYGGDVGVGNIIRNSAIVRDPADSHTGHGYSIKASGRPLEHTLIEDCTIDHVAQAIELRHHDVRYTVARNVVATGSRTSPSNLVTFRDDTSYNTIENCVADHVYEGVKFVMNAGEDGGIQAGGHHNRVINTVFDGCRYGITIGGFGGTPLESTDNSFEHCTFDGMAFMFALPIDFGDTNTFTNCNITDVEDEAFRSGTATTSYTYTNTWNIWADVSGEGNMSVDPMYVDAAGGDFTPGNAVLQEGVVTPDIRYDFHERERAAPPTIGAIER